MLFADRAIRITQAFTTEPVNRRQRYIHQGDWFHYHLVLVFPFQVGIGEFAGTEYK